MNLVLVWMIYSQNWTEWFIQNSEKWMIHLQTGLNDFTKMKLEMVWMICLLNKMINFSQIGLNDLLTKIIEHIWMIHSLNTQVDSLTYWSEWLTEMIEWFTESAQMTDTSGVNDSFTKWSYWFTHKAKRLVYQMTEQFVREIDWLILSQTILNNSQIRLNWSDWVLSWQLTESLNHFQWMKSLKLNLCETLEPWMDG